MLKTKVSQIGDSTGILLSKEALQQLNVTKDDEPCLVEGPNALTLTPCKQCFDKQMRAAEGVMKRYRNALRHLAK